MMMKNKQGPLATFSAVFDEVPKSNERTFIEALVQKCGFAPSLLAADQCNPFQVPAELARTQAEVHIPANLYLNWGLYGLAQQRGVRVMLDGFDGDTTLSHGTAYLAELARAARWIELARLAPAVAALNGDSAPGMFWNYLWGDGLWPRLPAPAQRVYRGVARRLRSVGRAHFEPCCVLNQKFVDRIGMDKYRESLRDSVLSPVRTEKAAHYQRLMLGVMPATLEMLEQAAAPFGVEVRFPFWDRRLVEFCLGLPPQLKIRDGCTRWIMRRSMEGLLPAEVQWRRGKSNMGHSFKHCLFKHGMDNMNEAEAAADKHLLAYVCPRHLDDARRRFRANSEDRATLFLWQVANLTLWLERTRFAA
jgi:asparagine synthase (glutamine-hydrolysing)